MYHQVATKLFVPTTCDQFSPAVSTQGADEVVAQVAVGQVGGGPTLNATLQQSNDLQRCGENRGGP